MSSRPQPVIRTEQVEAIAARLRQRAGDHSALLGLDCSGCGVLGRSYTGEDADPVKATAAEALAALEKPERGWSLSECRRCGALFVQSAVGPPAADDLFESTLHLDRISVDRAMELLPTESAHAEQERTVEQVLALLLGGACYLNNFWRVQQSRVGEERFIYRDGDVVLDAWHVQATDSLGELTWCTLDEFRRALPRLFPGGSVDSRYVVPSERIPAVIRREAPLRYRRIQQGLSSALEDEALWVLLAVYTDTAAPRRTGPRRRKKQSVRRDSAKRVARPREAYLHRGPVTGWQYVSCEAGRVTAVKVDEEDLAKGRLDQLLRDKPTAAAEPVPAAVLKRLRAIESGVVDALARLEAGEGCAHPLGVLALLRGRFVVADLAGALVQNLLELDRARALDHLASGLARARGLTFVPLSLPDRDRVSALLDPDARWTLFLAGRLVVGGGPTTDMQWTLGCQDGRFRMDGNQPEWIDEARARSIVCEKRYGWLRVT